MPFIPGTLDAVVTSPTGFGKGPKTFQDIVRKNNFMQRYVKYMQKNETMALEIYRDNKTTMDYSEVFYHFQFPSDSNPEVLYDVVLRFYTTDPAVRKDTTLRNYKIQVFSNSPGFAFQFAYVYYKNGLMIKEFEDHYSPMALNTPPEKSNPLKAVGYDYTVFFALYHLKINPAYLRKTAIQKFGEDLNKFDHKSIPTSDEVYERRSPHDIFGFNKIKKKAARFVNNVEKKVSGVLGFNTSSRKPKKASNTKKTVAKGARATRASKASNGHRKHRYFK